MPKKMDVSRRDFVKSSVATAAAVSVFTILPSQNARAVAPIKVGLIGCGGRGRGAMNDCIKSYDGVQIEFLADVFLDRIEKAKEELNKLGRTTEIQIFQGFKAYHEAVKMDVDYVILATPPCYRAETLEAAIEAKKNVFMEKPASVDPQGIRRVIAAGEKADQLGLKIAAGTQRRHQAEYIETINRIKDGAIGEILNAQAFWCGGPIAFRDRTPEMTDLEWQMRSWYHFGWLSGDHIVEQHVHNLDVINWVVGAHPVKAYGIGGRAWQQRGDIWDHHSVHFQYENGLNLLSMCAQYPLQNGRVEERIQGTKGMSNCANWIMAEGKEWKSDVTRSFPYVQEHADLIDAIQNNKKLNEARNVAESTMTAIMGRMAEYQGRDMTWDEALNSDERYPIYYELRDLPESPVPIPGGQKYTGEEGWNPG